MTRRSTLGPARSSTAPDGSDEVVRAGRMTRAPATVGDSTFRSPRALGGSRREGNRMGSVIKKRRKRMAKKKHRKLLRKTRVARRKAGK